MGSWDKQNSQVFVFVVSICIFQRANAETSV